MSLYEWRWCVFFATWSFDLLGRIFAMHQRLHDIGSLWWDEHNLSVVAIYLTHWDNNLDKYNPSWCLFGHLMFKYLIMGFTHPRKKWWSCLLLKNERITAKVQLLIIPFLLLTEDEVLKAYIYLPLALKIKANKLYRLSKTEVRYLEHLWAVVGLDI